VTDDHSPWKSAQDDPMLAESVIRSVIQDAIGELGIANVPVYLRPALCAIGSGDAPGNEKEELSKPAHGRLAWVSLLRRYIGSTLAVQPNFMRPPRRFPHLVGIVPGRRRRGARPKVMAVIDTSASMSFDLLNVINGELARLAKDFSVIVVECDASIHRVYDYRSIEAVQGRGGTDLRPVFEAAFLSQHRPDLIIYFTDGDGPAPDSPPSRPTVWCLTPGGDAPTTWGRVIEMSDFWP
jgi:predicted metal-dependent peptidase